MKKLVPVFQLALYLGLLILCSADQGTYLRHYLNSRRSSHDFSLSEYAEKDESPVYLLNQDGQMDAARIDRLPGEPDGVDFAHYAGYVTVNPEAGRALFYYFAESPVNSSTNPLVLWLNGGPGCSSFGYGAMEELGPFRVNSDGKTLYRNPYSWNNIANVIFLESPAGVGFSYSNTTADYNNTGDTRTAADSYNFLVNWLERFPQYKTRDFYITGESYAGHYVPQLANIILLKNKNTKTVINLKGIAIGNGWVDDTSMAPGFFEHVWTHALNSDETHAAIFKYCNFANNTSSDQCESAAVTSYDEIGNIDINNMYAPVCQNPVLKNGSTGSVNFFDPCSDIYVGSYLNTPEVQSALHVMPTTWSSCSSKLLFWKDWQSDVLPTIQNIMVNGARVWLYSGDIDANVPVTSTRYAINSLKLPVEAAWRPWYHDSEVGGYVVGYKGLTFVTVRGAGHLVPSYQPQRALTMISSFLHGVSPPSS